MTPVDLLAKIIAENTPESIWTGSPLEGYRSLGNTNRGEIGEEFVRRFLESRGIEVNKGTRTARTDMFVAGHSFELPWAQTGLFSSTTCGLIATIATFCAWASALKRSYLISGGKEKSPKARPARLCGWLKVRQ